MTNELTIREANPADFINIYEWLFYPDYADNLNTIIGIENTKKAITKFSAI